MQSLHCVFLFKKKESHQNKIKYIFQIVKQNQLNTKTNLFDFFVIFFELMRIFTPKKPFFKIFF